MRSIFYLGFLAIRLVWAQDGLIRNDGIHLAICPRCVPLGGPYGDVNAGLTLSNIKVIVSFGDSYSDDGKHDGSTPDPAILSPPNPYAGGRSTNGLTWVEDLAADIGAIVKGYASAGACTDLRLWPSNPTPVDFLNEIQVFLSQNNNFDPDTTLYSIFFGINDYVASTIDGDHMPQAAQVILDQIKILAGPPTNARSFLIADDYGRGQIATSGEEFKQKIFEGISDLHLRPTGGLPPLKIAFADFAEIWNGVLGPNPGYAAFGYTSPQDYCTSCAGGGCTIDSLLCADPDHTFGWTPGHPSKQTHRIMADFVEEVVEHCLVN